MLGDFLDQQLVIFVQVGHHRLADHGVALDDENHQQQADQDGNQDVLQPVEELEQEIAASICRPFRLVMAGYSASAALLSDSMAMVRLPG